VRRRLGWAVAGTGAVALISLFLPWYGVSAGIFSTSVGGWGTGFGWIGALLIVAAGVYVVLEPSDVQPSRLRAGPAMVILGASSSGTVIVAIRWLTLGQVTVLGFTSRSVVPHAGIVVALLAGIVQAVCAVGLLRTSGEARLPAAHGPASAGRSAPPAP
jgi:hypothetical protein